MTEYSDGSVRLDYAAVILVSQVIHYGRYLFDEFPNHLGYPAGKLLVQLTRPDLCHNAIGVNLALYRAVYPGKIRLCVAGIILNSTSARQ